MLKNRCNKGMEFLKFLQNNAYYATTFMLYNTTFLVRLSLVDTYFGMFFR